MTIFIFYINRGGFLFFLGILTTLNLSGVMNAYAYDTFFEEKGCVKRDFLPSLDFSLIGVVFLFFPGILTTLNLSGVMNAYA